MPQDTIHYYKTLPSIATRVTSDTDTSQPRLEPATCTEAEPFALQVLDDSMEPEFKNGCVILIDPTGRATDGSFVLAEQADGEYLFRQLKKGADNKWTLIALNDNYPPITTANDLSAIEGVIVQRAGVRRSYHKNYS